MLFFFLFVIVSGGQARLPTSPWLRPLRTPFVVLLRPHWRRCTACLFIFLYFWRRPPARRRSNEMQSSSRSVWGRRRWKETFNEILSAVTELMAFSCPNTNIRLVFPSEKKRSFTKHSRKPVKETLKGQTAEAAFPRSYPRLSSVCSNP